MMTTEYAGIDLRTMPLPPLMAPPSGTPDGWEWILCSDCEAAGRTRPLGRFRNLTGLPGRTGEIELKCKGCRTKSTTRFRGAELN